MEYIPPLNALPGDEENEDRSHWNADPGGANQALREGSYPSAIGFEACQREIVNVIEEAELVPDGEDYTQLAQAIMALIDANAPETPEVDMVSVLQAVYRVGNYYINETDSRNPNDIMGYNVGTWVAVEDKMIMAAGSTYAAETEGGSATTTQTTGTLAAHPHTVPHGTNSGGTPGIYSNSNVSANNAPATTSTAGSGGAMNNLPPYISAYVWKRTA